MNKKLPWIIFVAVVVLHLLVVSWMWTSFELEATKAATTYERTGDLPKVKYPLGFKALMFPVGLISIVESRGALPVWGRLFQSIIWGAIAFLISKSILTRRKKEPKDS